MRRRFSAATRKASLTPISDSRTTRTISSSPSSAIAPAGHRPGVFPAAVDLLNLLRPEFVMSVGDFIEGYVEDEGDEAEVVKAQWAEIDELLEPLKMPLFFVHGQS